LAFSEEVIPLPELFAYGGLITLFISNLTQRFVCKQPYGDVSIVLTICIYLLAISIHPKQYFVFIDDDVTIRLAFILALISIFISLQRLVIEQFQGGERGSEKYISRLLCALIIGSICILGSFLPLILCIYTAILGVFLSLIPKSFLIVLNIKNGKNIDWIYQLCGILIFFSTVALSVSFIVYVTSSDNSVVTFNDLLLIGIIQQALLLFMSVMYLKSRITHKDMVIGKDGTQSEFNKTHFSLFVHEARNQLSIFNLVLSNLRRQSLSIPVMKKVDVLRSTYRTITILLDYYRIQFDFETVLIQKKYDSVSTEHIVDELVHLFPDLVYLHHGEQSNTLDINRETISRILKLVIQAVYMYSGDNVSITLITLPLEKSCIFNFNISNLNGNNAGWLSLWNSESSHDNHDAEQLTFAYIQTIKQLVVSEGYKLNAFRQSSDNYVLMLSVFSTHEQINTDP
jgi:hypothetical protein